MIASGLLLSLILFYRYVLPLQPHTHSWPYIPHCMTTIKSSLNIRSPPTHPEYLYLNVFYINSQYPKMGCSSPLPNWSFIFLPCFSGGYTLYTQSPSIWSLTLQICHISLKDALSTLMFVKITWVGILFKLIIKLPWGWTVYISNNLSCGATQHILRSYFA